jgi:hypothetical protein
MVYRYNAVCYGQRAGNTAFDAQRLLAVTAGNGKADPVLFFDFYFGIDLYVFERPCHVFFVDSGKCAVILAQMAAQAPLFVHIDLFHPSAPCISGIFIPKMGVLVKTLKGLVVVRYLSPNLRFVADNQGATLIYALNVV